MYFKGLIDMECFQSNLEKMEKLCNSNSCKGELDFKSILINNGYIPCAENSSGDSTNLGRSKVSRMVRKFQ
jgi:retinoblastoma-like protein 1